MSVILIRLQGLNQGGTCTLTGLHSIRLQYSVHYDREADRVTLCRNHQYHIRSTN